jgi:hypothetical protein
LKALFLIPKSIGDHFSLTIKALSAFSNLSSTTVLGNSVEKLGFRDVEIQGDGSTSRAALEHNLFTDFTDRMNAPLASAQGCINVALRRLPTGKTQDTPINILVSARYRVDMEYIRDKST